MKKIKYSFHYIKNCNMCGSSTSHHSILGKRLNTSQGKNPKGKIGITTTIVQCNVCKLIFSNPQPVPDNIQDHYGKPPEDYWIEQYFKIDDNYFSGELETLKKLTSISSHFKALDIGAGLGKCMIAMEKVGIESYGFEPSESFREAAISRMHIDKNKLKLGMIENVEYEKESFDFITFGAVLEHLYNPSESINKAMGWLKPGGLIHIEVPSSDWLINKLINAVYKLMLTDYVGNISPMHPPYHLYEFGLKSFEKNGEINNYKILHHQYYVCTTYLPKFINGLASKYMAATDKGMQLAIWLHKVK